MIHFCDMYVCQDYRKRLMPKIHIHHIPSLMNIYEGEVKCSRSVRKRLYLCIYFILLYSTFSNVYSLSKSAIFKSLQNMHLPSFDPNSFPVKNYFEFGKRYFNNSYFKSFNFPICKNTLVCFVIQLVKLCLVLTSVIVLPILK